MIKKGVKSQFWLKFSCVVSVLNILATPMAHSQQMSPSDTNWAVGGHDINNWRDQPNTSINASNVVNMKPKWVFTADGDVWATPAVVNNVVYFPDLAGNFYAVDATSGALIWKHAVSDWTNIAQDYSRNDPAVYNGMLILGDQGGVFASWNGSQTSGSGARVIAVNATTGKPTWVTQVETFPSAVVTSSPVVYNNIVYVGVASAEEGLASVAKINGKNYPCCTFRGSLVALNAQTGAKLWQVYTVPDNQGVVGGYSGGAIWGATPAIDVARNSVYVGTGNNYSVPSAATACIKANPNNTACTVKNDYFDSVLAIDLRSGAIKWARRAMASDVWNEDCFQNQSGVGNCPVAKGHDYDFGGSGPNLIAAHNGGSNLHNYFGQNDILGIGEKAGCTTRSTLTMEAPSGAPKLAPVPL